MTGFVVYNLSKTRVTSKASWTHVWCLCFGADACSGCPLTDALCPRPRLFTPAKQGKGWQQNSRAARIELALHQARGERGQQSGAGHERPEVRSTGDVTLYCTVRLVHSVTSHSPTVHASYSCDSCWISLIQMIQLSKSAMPYKSLLLTKAVQLWKIFHCFL